MVFSFVDIKINSYSLALLVTYFVYHIFIFPGLWKANMSKWLQSKLKLFNSKVTNNCQIISQETTRNLCSKMLTSSSIKYVNKFFGKKHFREGIGAVLNRLNRRLTIFFCSYFSKRIFIGGWHILCFFVKISLERETLIKHSLKACYTNKWQGRFDEWEIPLSLKC